MRAFSSPSSLRGQLLLWLLGPLFLIGLVAIYDGYRSARQTADSVSDRVLSGSALAIAERVFVNEDNLLEVDIPYLALQMLTSSEDDRVFYRIEDADGGFVTGYRRLATKQPVPDIGEVVFSTGRFRDLPVRIASYSGAASSNTKSLGFRVIIAETTNARSAIAQSILLRSLVRQAVLLIGAAILVWFAVSRALRPLHTVEEAVGRRSAEDVRPITHSVPSEVGGLVQTINELVGRFASSIAALQNFTSNTSHQFRTPLALIKTHLELASRAKDKEQRTLAISDARAAVDDAERLMSQLLLLARLDSASKEKLQQQTCDLTAVTREVCEDFTLRLSQTYSLPVDLGFEAKENIVVCADKTLTQEVVRNLIDNAIKHGGTPIKIDVTVEKNGNFGKVSVRDYGKGFNAQLDSKNLKQMDFSVQPADSGTGKGLSIVREIVQLLKGKIVARKLLDPSGMLMSVSFSLKKNANS